jgi:two-component system sensor histidine kinase DegS
MENDPNQQNELRSSLKDQIQTELDQYKRELKEIALMLEQSQLEVNKLAQRNASITAHLQTVKSQFDNLPRPDIRMAYDSALDAQQRLYVMKGQVEKLQSDQLHLNRYLKFLEPVFQYIEGGNLGDNATSNNLGATGIVEMMIQSQETERQRLSRQMHDGPAQALSNFILQTEIAMRLFEIDQVKAKEELNNLKSTATGTFRQVRDFIFELRPMMLDDLGLVPTLKRYVDASKNQYNMNVRLSVSGAERRLEGFREVIIFRSVQELINNANRHSQASEVKVQVDLGETHVKVMVDDDGKGFDTSALVEKSGMGLGAIRDRLGLLGGQMDIDSVIGKGTRISFQLPAGYINPSA